MPVIRCSSPAELLEQLHTLQGIPDSGTWYFRGQEDASWGLIPSLFRLSLSNEKQFEETMITALVKNLTIRSMVPDRFLTDYDHLLAMAQHYGCPTRVLDWTLSPLVAAYFAASGALRRSNGRPLAVFAVADICRVAPHALTSPILQPPTGANPNMEAQSGVLIRHDWSCRNYWLPTFEYAVKSAPKSVDVTVASRFLRLELDGEHAASLLEMLSARGLDAVSLFPGLHGLVATATDWAWYEQRKSKR